MRLTKYQTYLHYFNLTLVLLTGMLGITSSAAFPTPKQLNLLIKLIPFPITLASRTLTLLLSIAMLNLAYHLHRRRRRAYLTIIIFTALITLTHLIKDLNLVEASISLITLISLVLTQNYYTAPSPPITLKLNLKRQTIFLFALILYLFSSFIWLQSHHLPPLYAHHIHLSIQFTLIFLEIYFFAFIFAPLAIKLQTSRHHYQLAQKILTQDYHPDYLNLLKLHSDKTIFLSTSKKSFLSYTLVGSSVLVLGDLVGNPQDFPQLIDQFNHFTTTYGLTTYFYQITDSTLAYLKKLKFKTLPIGKEALVNLKTFSIETLKTPKLRQTYRKFLRRQYQTQLLFPPYPNQLILQLKHISDVWLTLPNHFERQFSVGYFSPSYLKATPIYLVKNPQGEIIAWINLHLFPHQHFATADLIRYLSTIPNGTMEFLFISLFLNLKTRGYHTFSLGLAPLPPAESPQEKILTTILKRLSFIFRFTGITNFKAKFADSWQNRYLAYHTHQSLILYPQIFRQATKLKNSIT